MSFVISVEDHVETVLFDEHHQRLCACDSWPQMCENGLTSFTLSVEDIIRVATPLIIAEWKRTWKW